MAELEEWDPIAAVESMKRAASSSGVDERLAELEAKERAHEQRRLDDVLCSFGVPELYRDNLHEPLKDTQAMQAVKRWMALDRKQKWCLVLGGSKGVGKSVAAAWWLAQVARDMHPSPSMFSRWWTINDIQRLSNYAQDLDRLWTVQSLVIDDLGVEFNDAKGNFASLLYGIIEKRGNSYLRTIITTNLNVSDFRQRYDDRICDRLNKGGMFAGASGNSLRRSA
jgi:DNA replication protein DnaC